MLSAEQLNAVERLAFRERFAPLMLGHLRDEHLIRGEEAQTVDELAELHIGLGRLFIYSPRSTFRFHRFALLRPELQATDDRFFYRIVSNAGINETSRLDTVERHILTEDNRTRWLDLV